MKLAWIWFVLVLALASSTSTPALAQEDFETSSQQSVGAGRWSMSFEVGHPLVAGVWFGYRMYDHMRGSVGGTILGDFAALAASTRFDVVVPASGYAVPFLTAGVGQYFLSKGDEDASPVAIFGALGVEYLFNNSLGVGAQIGLLKTFNSSGSGDVRVYSIREDDSRAFFNIAGQYYW